MIRNYTGVSGSRVAWLIAQAEENKVLAVVSTGRAAKRLAADLSFCAPDSQIIVMPEEDDIEILYEARSRESQVQRIRGIHALVSDGAGDSPKVFVIAPVSAAVRLMESPERYVSGIIDLSMGDVMEPADLRQRLVGLGYVSATVTESPGEFTSKIGRAHV